jgi:D-serine deaminase-like pyridoxal phosphate-dependent protein
MAAALESLETPCLIVDRSKLRQNLERMAAAVAARGVTLRSHLKAAKSGVVARLAAPDRRAPIAVSTLRETKYFFNEGHEEIAIFDSSGIAIQDLLVARRIVDAANNDRKEACG